MALRRLTLAAVAAVGVFILGVLIRSPAILDATYANGDNASALVLGEFMGERGPGQLVLGNYAWLEPLYLENATRWLPHHKLVWQLLPLAMYAVTLWGVWWSLARAASRRAGTLVVLAMAAPAPLVLGWVGVPDARGHTLMHTALLAAFLVTTPHLSTWTQGRRAAWAVGLAVTLAPGVASDDLLLVGGVAGFLVAVISAAWLRVLDRWSAALAGVACLIGVAAGRLLIVAARHDDVVASPRVFTFVGTDQLMPHVRLLLESFALFAHGRIGGPIGLRTAIEEVVGLAVIVGVPLLAAAALRPAARLVTDDRQPVAARLLVVYWGTSLVTVAVAFVSTSAPLDLLGGRYVTTLWPALLALAVLIFPRRAALPALATLATVCALLGCVDLASRQYTVTSPFPRGGIVDDLQRFAAREGLDHGYAGYWDAATMTAHTDFKLHVYPVLNCGQGGDGRCPFYLHRLDAWYVPKPRTRSFYVVDSVQIEPVIGPPPARWGQPVRTATFGQLTVYVYDYDIAARLPEGT